MWAAFIIGFEPMHGQHALPYMVGALLLLLGMAWCIKGYGVYVRIMRKDGNTCEVIVIEESPLPTRMPCSPFPKTPEPPTRQRCRRGGWRGGYRRNGHKRRSTQSYSPTQKHHCGFVCLLKLQGQRPTQKKIRLLREAIVQDLITSYHDDLTVASVRVRSLVHQSSASLDSYVTDLRKNMWASKVELEIGARILHVGAYLKIGKDVEVLGDVKPTKDD